MSRSYKKTPRSGDKKNKFLKKYANRKYRKLPLEDTVQHKSYKKTFCSYDICDYEDVGTTFEQYYQGRIKWWRVFSCYSNEPFPTREKAWQEYLKYFIRK